MKQSSRKLVHGLRPDLPEIESCITAGDPVRGRFQDLELESHFQPIYSVAHSRVVGFEGLLRARDNAGDAVAPPAVFARARTFRETLLLDRLARAVHLRNFVRQPEAQNDNTWLLLNCHPQVFAESGRNADVFRSLLDGAGLLPHRVVIEVLEHAIDGGKRLSDAVDHYRDLGCLIALDDFGAGQSNFDRVWELQPDIVKLDRSVIARAAREARVRRMLPSIVALLHEAGCLVLIEGVETEFEAVIAMDAEVDMVQGYLFARPVASLATTLQANAVFDELEQKRDAWPNERDLHRKGGVASHRQAVDSATDMLRAGCSLEAATDAFLKLPGALGCYLIDERGNQQGHAIRPHSWVSKHDRRFAPLADTAGANWARRHYFRRAIESPGILQITRPYLSATHVAQCITLSVTTQVGGRTMVLCGDVAWIDEIAPLVLGL